jgi:hypothetical protein
LGRRGRAGRGEGVLWWTVVVFVPNGLCRFRVKNTLGVERRVRKEGYLVRIEGGVVKKCKTVVKMLKQW